MLDFVAPEAGQPPMPVLPCLTKNFWRQARPAVMGAGDQIADQGVEAFL
jgi:hypothetical protein